MASIRSQRVIGLLLAVAMLLTLGTVMMIPANADNPFPDVPAGAWYEKAVVSCYEQGLVSGYEDKTFRPDSKLTRAEMAVIMNKLLKLKDSAENTYKDVKAGQWYTDAVLHCVKAGVMSGYDAKTFGISDTLNREQGAVILAKAFGVQAQDGKTTFADDASISKWAVGSVKAMAAKGLIAGIGNNKFGPQEPLTRAQMCQIIYVAQSGTEPEPDPSENPDEDAAVTAPALLKSVKVYTTDYETKEWQLDRTVSYQYENKYPTEIRSVPEDEEQPTGIKKFEYTFKEGKPASRKDYDGEGNLTHTMEYNNGRAWLYSAVSEDSTNVSMYQYAYDGPYFTSVLMDRRYGGDSMEEIDSVQVITENDLLKQTINSGVYANTNEGDVKEWQRFNGTYTVNYDKNGIVSDTYGEFRAGPSGPQEKVEVTVKDGQVVEAVFYRTPEEGEQVPEAKYVFEYTDETIDAARYSLMINDIIMGESSYYLYIWY